MKLSTVIVILAWIVLGVFALNSMQRDIELLRFQLSEVIEIQASQTKVMQGNQRCIGDLIAAIRSHTKTISELERRARHELPNSLSSDMGGS